MKSSKMDILCISVCIFALFATSLAQEPLKVYFENQTAVDAVEGAKAIEFRCHLNRGAMFVINNKVDIVHVNPVTKEETIISSAADLVEGKPEFYGVAIDQHPEGTQDMVLDFIIKTVRYEDDGIYKCHVHPGGKSDSTEEGFAEREIVVHRPVSSLKLVLGDFDPIVDSPKDALKIDHGEYKVACIAEGSNPATEDVHLFFHGLRLPHSDPVITAMEGNERMFKTQVNGSLNIVVSNSGQELACQSMDSTGQTMSVKLAISVNTYDPVVTCNDTEAHIGQDNPILLCIVNHTGMEVDGYSFQMGDTGEIIKAGDKHPKNIAVTVSNVGPGISEVQLDLHKAEKAYLDKDYYILIDMTGGHTSREKVRLSKKDAPVTNEGNGGGEAKGKNGGGDSDAGPANEITKYDGTGHGVRLAPTVLLYLLVCVAALLSRH